MLTGRIGLKSAIATIVLAFATACTGQSDTDSGSEDPSVKGSAAHIKSATVAIDDNALRNADANMGDWLTHGRNYSEDRYSTLDQISKENLDSLGLAWTLEVGSTRGIQATPIVVDGVMYFTGPWSVVYAVDARKGELIWKHDPKVDRAKAADFCCGVVNRGVAIYKGAVFVATLDGRLISLDAVSGAINWSTMTIPEESNYSITGAPRIANGKVLIGNGGAEFLGTRGYVTAYDAATGDEIWRFYTVPGDPSKPFENPILEEAAKTWTGEWWKQGGGGTAWDAIVYDPEFNSVYIGVGNGTHWNREIRSPEGGDNLFLSSIVAVDADSGAYKWHYQTTPGDTWDYTATQPIILADLEIDGAPRKALMQAPKNGYFYVIDRENGALISADSYVYQNWTIGIDEDGRPIEKDGARYTDEKIHWIAPSSHGGHNWFPMSYNHETGLVYIPAVNQSGPYLWEKDVAFDSEQALGSGLELGVSLGLYFYKDQVIDPDAPAPGVATGELIAYDPIKQERAWAIPFPSRYNGGLLSTSNGLLMQGDAGGFFRIRDARSGEELWAFDVRAGVISSPITYLVDGEQYITLLVEWGGGQGQTYKLTDNIYPGTIYTFKLGGTAEAPAKLPTEENPITSRTTDAEPISIGRGYDVYLNNCFGCHGDIAKGGGAIPDLTRSDDAMFDAYEDILLNGALAQLGMPIHSHLSERDVDDMRNFVLYYAQSVRARVPARDLTITLAGYLKQAHEASGEESEAGETATASSVAVDTSISTSAGESAVMAGDPIAGERSAAICKSCHTFDKGGRNGVGPNLWGMLGRDIASKEEFRYSAALTALDGSWTRNELDAYIKAPLTYAPGTTMAIGVANDKQRADIIEYLATLND